MTRARDLADLAGAIPVGAVMHFAMDTAPDGWLKANGADVSRSTYAGLFSAIGTTFGDGDGSTTFTLPDLRGEFVRGWDDGRDVDTNRTFGSTQEGQNEEHKHDVWTRPHTGAEGKVPGKAYFNMGYPVNFGDLTYAVNIDSTGVRASGGFLYTDDRGGSESRPRNISMLACIKF